MLGCKSPPRNATEENVRDFDLINSAFRPQKMTALWYYGSSDSHHYFLRMTTSGKMWVKVKRDGMDLKVAVFRYGTRESIEYPGGLLTPAEAFKKIKAAQEKKK